MVHRVARLLALAAFLCTSAPLLAVESAVPLSADAQDRPTAPVMINGRGPFEMVIDTAAQRMGLGEGLVSDLGLAPLEGARAMLHGATGAMHMNLYRLDSVALASSRRSGVLATQMAGHGEAPGHSGVVGADAFDGMRVEFDFENSRLKIDSEPRQAGPAGFATIPARIELGTFVIVPVTIGGVSAVALVDTGARHSIANPALMRAMGYSESDSRLVANRAVGGATNQAAVVYSQASAELRIGETRMGAIAVRFSDLPVFGALGLSGGPAIILGADVWRGLRAMAIDYPRRELQLRQ